MLKNTDKNYDYEGNLAEIIHMSKALEEKINSFNNEVESISGLISYYDQIKEDITHIRENTVMKPQIGSKLSTIEKKFLNRRREIKNVHKTLKRKGLLENILSLLANSREVVSKYEDVTINDEFYTVKTDAGKEIMQMLEDEKVRFTFPFVIEECGETLKKTLSESNSSIPEAYSVVRKNKIWYMNNILGETVVSNKKLMVVIDFILDNKINYNKLIIETEKASFDILYTARQKALVNI